ncbi:MAG TPA: nitrate/nitrite transporter NrtS [Nostocaceae cyanobacterium]|nr:nitrate/nitrite transporter NrtS [Nostocaceae cyanobacterium]
MSNFIKGYLSSLIDPKFLPTGVRVALVVGSILFAINHGSALVSGHMNRERWTSGLLTYLVPYLVSVYGQYVSHYRHKTN